MAPHVWSPEHPVDATLARALVHAQFPALADHDPVRVGQGWDADVWRFGELAFRFPRRAAGVPLIATELAVLPVFAPRLPLAIPRPTHVGRSTPAFPHAFYGHPFVSGIPADLAGLDDDARVALAPALGHFVRTLHALTPESVGAPADEFKWDMASKARRARALVPALATSSVMARLPEVIAILDDPPQHRTDGAAVLLHGDLYLRHLLVDAHGDLCGVIDWGDVRGGDPAIDLAVAYSFLPPAARPAFWDAYGPADTATRQRARLTALANHGVSLMAYALDIKDSGLAFEAARSVIFAIEGE